MKAHRNITSIISKVVNFQPLGGLASLPTEKEREASQTMDKLSYGDFLPATERQIITPMIMPTAATAIMSHRLVCSGAGFVGCAEGTGCTTGGSAGCTAEGSVCVSGGAGCASSGRVVAIIIYPSF